MHLEGGKAAAQVYHKPDQRETNCNIAGGREEKMWHGRQHTMGEKENKGCAPKRERKRSIVVKTMFRRPNLKGSSGLD